MEPTAQGSSSTFPARDPAKTEQNGGRRVMPQPKAIAQESKTARHVEDPKPPTPIKNKGRPLTPETPMSGGSIPIGPSRSGEVTKARARSVPPSQSQRISPMKNRGLDATGARADKVSPNPVPTENQVRPKATTSSSGPSKLENTISQCNVTDNGIQINKIWNSYLEESRRKDIQDLKCIQNLMITNPKLDKADIVYRREVVCNQHLQKVCEHESYKRWKTDDKIPLLWIYSHDKYTVDFKKLDFETGDQKRVVAVAVANELERSSVVRDNVRDNALSYMFCQNSKIPGLKQNDTAAILRGLMWLLTSTQESLTKCLQENYDRGGKKMYTDEQAEHALSEIFSEWLKGTNVGRVYLVVGAIDECYFDRKKILDLIIRYCKNLPKVKWVITSDYDDIYSPYIKYINAELKPHDLSFETLYLNERSQKGRKRTKRWKKTQSRKGENLEGYVGEFFVGAAGEAKNEKPEVPGQEEGPNAGDIPNETTPLLPNRTPSSTIMGGSTCVQQQDGASETSSSVIPKRSANRECCCVVQ